MDIGFLAQYVLSGIMLGVVYAMVAVGFTLYFGVLDVVNFSHGDVLTAGAFVTIVVPLIVFFSLQRYFVRGLLAGSVKGG